jgi:hypothetical protein
MQVAENPNASKPKLGLGSLRAKPLPLSFKDAESAALAMVPGLPFAPKRCASLPPASVLAWLRDQFPLVIIAGEPVSEEQVTSHKNAKAAALAARFWCRPAAWEIGQLFPEDQREDVERFVVRHRLSSCEGDGPKVAANFFGRRG